MAQLRRPSPPPSSPRAPYRARARRATPRPARAASSASTPAAPAASRPSTTTSASASTPAAVLAAYDEPLVAHVTDAAADPDVARYSTQDVEAAREPETVADELAPAALEALEAARALVE